MSSYEFIIDGDIVVADVTMDSGNLTAVVNGQNYTLTPAGQNLFAVYVNGRRSVLAAVKYQGVYYLDIDSHLFEIREAADDVLVSGAGDHGGDKDKVRAPMPGKIVKLLVQTGDHVEIGQPLVIVEAMKMENQVNARAAGIVKAVYFNAGDQVDAVAPIIELEVSD
jgi:3-methylcrotonyl-CoA carboxylase alpha subunit